MAHRVVRIYDPTTGRWINRDPIREDGGWNLYEYCKSNPIWTEDPLGLYDYSEKQTLQLLQKAKKDAQSGFFSGLFKIYKHSTTDFDFSHNEHNADTWCIQGKKLSAAQFGNFIAGYQGRVWDDTFLPNRAPYAIGAVYAAGIIYHVKAALGVKNASYSRHDLLDSSGRPDIHAGSILAGKTPPPKHWWNY